MGISTPRVVLGGLVAGLVLNLGELAVNVWLLGGAWSDARAPLGIRVGVTDLILWGVGSFLLGIVGVWIYAGIGMMGMHAFPAWLVAVALLWGFVEVEIAVYLGAWLYREGELATA